MKTLNSFFALLLAFAIVACGETKETTTESDYGNPAAEGFNEAASDAKAIAIAEK